METDPGNGYNNNNDRVEQNRERKQHKKSATLLSFHAIDMLDWMGLYA